VNAIWKYDLRMERYQEIFMPSGAVILSLQIQKECPCLWVKVNTDEKMIARKIMTYGTGHELTDNEGNYIGSYQLTKLSLIFHVFEVLGKE